MEFNDARSIRDRGMKKWKPFASIPEQHQGLRRIFDDLNKIEKPTLSEDQVERINQMLQKAVHTQEDVLLIHYKDGYKVNELGKIQHIDYLQKRFIFIDDIFELRTLMLLDDILDVQSP